MRGLSYDAVYSDLCNQIEGFDAGEGAEFIPAQPEGATRAQFTQAIGELGWNRIQERAQGLR